MFDPWKLDYKESWTLKNWCFWTVVLEKTLESPLDCKEIQPIHPKGNQPWIFIGRIDAEAEAPILWPPDAKKWLIRKDPDAGIDWWQEEKGATEDEMVGRHHRLNGHELEQTLRDSERQGSLACFSPWGCKELNTTWRLNNNQNQRREHEGITRRNVHSSSLFGFYSLSAQALLYFVLKLSHFCCYHASPLPRVRCIESHVDSERESVFKVILMTLEDIKSSWGVVLCIYSNLYPLNVNRIPSPQLWQ